MKTTAEMILFSAARKEFGRPVCLNDEAPLSAAEQAAFTSTVPYTEGLPGDWRTESAGQNSGVLLVLLTAFLFVAFNFKHFSRLFKTFAQDLWSMRRRENAFDDHTTNEGRTLISLLVQLWVFQGILLFSRVNSVSAVSEDNIFAVAAAMIGLATLFYLSQLAIYSTLGSVFSDEIGTMQLVKGFNASQSLLGISLIIPASISIFYPDSAGAMFWIGIILYFIARVIFVCKGFRIFYHNFSSLLYFILYLCTLEIIPVILLYSGALFLADYFNC